MTHSSSSSLSPKEKVGWYTPLIVTSHRDRAHLVKLPFHLTKELAFKGCSTCSWCTMECSITRLTLVDHGHTKSAQNCLAHCRMGHLSHLKSGPAPCKPSHLLGDTPGLVAKKRLGPHGEEHWGILETEADKERG